MRAFGEKMKVRVRGNKAYIHFRVDLEKKCFLEQFKFVIMVIFRLVRQKDRLCRNTIDSS
jgi:hypothetical protein